MMVGAFRRQSRPGRRTRRGEPGRSRSAAMGGRRDGGSQRAAVDDKMLGDEDPRQRPRPRRRWRWAVGTENGMSEKSTLDAAEVARFAALAEEWWNPSGAGWRRSHRLQPLGELAYVKEAICRKIRPRTRKTPRALTGLSPSSTSGLRRRADDRAALPHGGDRHGHRTGPGECEPSPPATPRKAGGPGDRLSRPSPSRRRRARPERFDVVTILEVVEHVSDVPPRFVAACASVVKPGGVDDRRDHQSNA